jgi:uncharacterized protein DUF4242
VPRYLVIRRFDVEADEMDAVGTRSKAIARDYFPQIVWEHSHVTVDDDGVVRTFCIYAAPGEQDIRDHAAMLGDHTVDGVHEVAGDVSPADFPG